LSIPMVTCAESELNPQYKAIKPKKKDFFFIFLIIVYY
jgi:hypothetical protein